MIFYLLKSVSCSAVLLIAYWGILRTEKIYTFNRFFLLGGLLMSICLPFISIQLPEYFFITPISHFISWPAQTPATLLTVPADLPFVFTDDSKSFAFPTNPWIWPCWGMYGLVFAALLIRFCHNLRLIWRSIVQNKIVQKGNLRIVLLPETILPYSFFNYVFVNQIEYEAHRIEPEIWQHEEAHINQWHSVDVLLVECCKIIFWFNPVVWFYRPAIVLNHEFLADEWVLKTHPNPSVYQYLLLNRFHNSVGPMLVSSFNYQITKTRFAMMYKTTSRPRAYALKTVCGLLSVLSIAVFSDFVQAQSPQNQLFGTKTVASNPNGASPEAVAEYEALIKKYVKKTKSKNGQEGFIIGVGMTETDRARLQALFLSMSAAQQSQQVYAMHPPLKPLPQITPTEKEYESYKNPKIYGVWIDGKKVPNSALNNYKAADFSQVFISRLYKNAQATIGFKYKFQLDLETHAYYEKYKAESLKDSKYWLWVNPQKQDIKSR